MYCYQCGTQIADQAKFCGGCGRTVEASQIAPKTQQNAQGNMETHINILAWLFIGTAILYAIGGFVLLISPGILRMLPIPTPPEVPFNIVQFVSSIAGLLGVIVLAFGAVNAAAGVGLLQYQTWGRTLALV